MAKAKEQNSGLPEIPRDNVVPPADDGLPAVETSAPASDSRHQSASIATAMIEVPLVPSETVHNTSREVHQRILPRHRPFFRRLRYSLAEQGATYLNERGIRVHVHSDSGVYHWLLDQFTTEGA